MSVSNFKASFLSNDKKKKTAFDIRLKIDKIPDGEMIKMIKRGEKNWDFMITSKEEVDVADYSDDIDKFISMFDKDMFERTYLKMIHDIELPI